MERSGFLRIQRALLLGCYQRHFRYSLQREPAARDGTRSHSTVNLYLFEGSVEDEKEAVSIAPWSLLDRGSLLAFRQTNLHLATFSTFMLS